MSEGLEKLTPKQIVEELDKYIIGQDNAKKAVAIALRNRMRRQMLAPEMREEISPKNIVMIGPTGVGKTEIARRLSKLVNAPFIKVEATKYTEVGYVGRDVESMIRDLMSVSVGMVKKEMEEDVKTEAELRTEDAILDLLLPGVGGRPKPEAGANGGINLGSIFSGLTGQSGSNSADAGGTSSADETPRVINLPGPGEEPADSGTAAADASTNTGSKKSSTREKFRQMLRDGKLEDKEVEVTVTAAPTGGMDMFSGMNLEDMGINIAAIPMFGGKKKKRKVTVGRAREILMAEELDKLIDQERVNEIARDRAQQMGIIFIDEIDKIAAKEGRGGSGEVSREGVQRDILPIVEGSKVNTKYGMVDTSHILFIAAGAFHMSKPSDLIPELQGRFPLRVELEDLTAEDFERILTQPKNALVDQYTALLDTEGVALDFTHEAIVRMSEIAGDVNSRTENIGARRLHTVLELLLEEVSFNAPDLKGQTISITKEYVDERLQNVQEDQDLSRYIL
ncbi:MAG: ATP-dependent protease ATPase subunit HslU [Spirochaetales bacterium]|uniref:ATP-dependent protease ATPase subunit HslU n=1 Tax=Candidatus Thalassospirochaeta sargassi TaxID=3119039 RepID=A0AAJ1IKC0_9SPIO|nr:ATP-dependent protease ATPase subunit HslU [Spirochaetales bacterium]